MSYGHFTKYCPHEIQFFYHFSMFYTCTKYMNVGDPANTKILINIIKERFLVILYHLKKCCCYHKIQMYNAGTWVGRVALSMQMFSGIWEWFCCTNHYYLSFHRLSSTFPCFTCTFFHLEQSFQEIFIHRLRPNLISIILAPSISSLYNFLRKFLNGKLKLPEKNPLCQKWHPFIYPSMN